MKDVECVGANNSRDDEVLCINAASEIYQLLTLVKRFVVDLTTIPITLT